MYSTNNKKKNNKDWIFTKTLFTISQGYKHTLKHFNNDNTNNKNNNDSNATSNNNNNIND